MNIEDYSTENETERRCKDKAIITADKKILSIFLNPPNFHLNWDDWL